jgi:sugar/nucleoside kinase (ribokinase family)
VAGTTGAGDSTIAGFLASIFKGLSPVEALNVAVAVGACCVEAPDATSGIRTWEGTVARMDTGWGKGAGNVTEKGWKVGIHGIWTGPLDRP